MSDAPAGLRVCALLLLSLMFSPRLVQAATYYVSTTGADSQSCPAAQSAATPRRSINSGIACLSSGDTLLIGPGHYHEFLTTYSGVGASPIPSGSAGAYTTLQAAQPGTVTLSFTPFLDFGAPIEIGDGASYIHIEGLVLDGQQHTTNGISIGHTTMALRFKDLVIHHVLAMGIEGGGTQHEFLNVSMHHIARTDGGSTTCPSKTCANPPGQLCLGYCHPYYYSGSGHVIDGGTYTDIDGWVFHWYASNSVIRNTCVRNAMVAGGLIGGGNVFVNNVVEGTGIGVFMTPGQTIVHNTIRATARAQDTGAAYGIYQQSGSANAIQNNLLQQLAGPPILLDGGGSTSSSNVAGNVCDVAAPGCSTGMVAQTLVSGTYPSVGASGGGTCTAAGVVPPPVAQPPVLPPPRHLRVRLVP